MNNLSFMFKVLDNDLSTLSLIFNFPKDIDKNRITYYWYVKLTGEWFKATTLEALEFKKIEDEHLIDKLNVLKLLLI